MAKQRKNKTNELAPQELPTNAEIKRLVEMTVTRLENWKVEVERNPNPRLVHVLKNIIAQIETLTELTEAKISYSYKALSRQMSILVDEVAKLNIAITDSLLEDDLIDRYGVLELIPPRHRPARQDGPIADPIVSREIERAQRIIEGQNFDIRRTLRKYSSLIEEQRLLIQQRRQDVLLDRAPPRLLEAQAPQRYAELRAAFGQETLHRVERQITLARTDEIWTEHLAEIAHIRDGIHLFSVSGFEPLDEFHKAVAQVFQDSLRRIDRDIVATFESAKITEDGIDLDSAELRGPGATWTYLVSDNPFGGWLERAFTGIREELKKALR